MSKHLTSSRYCAVTKTRFHAVARQLLLAASLLGSVALPAAHAAGEHAGEHLGEHPGGHPESPVGQPGVAAQVSRTIAVDMTDAMRFHPSRIDVKQGETVRLKVKNSGVIKHELVIGTEADLKSHDEQMKKFPGMEHEDPAMVSVAPGHTGEIVWKFSTAGTVDFACLQPGHFDAGMVGQVAVAANGQAAQQSSVSGGVASGSRDASDASDWVDAEVRRVDTEGRKLTLRHGEIRNLDMPGMTMIFRVKESVPLNTIKVGDKVRFTAVSENGLFVLTQLRHAD